MDWLRRLWQADRSDHRAIQQHLETVHNAVRGVLVVVHRMEANMATQEQVDALTASVQQASTQIGDGVQRANDSLDAVRNDIADLKSAHPDVDLSSLEASVGNLSTAVAPLSTLADNLSELDSENPELPPVEPTPAPSDGGDTSGTGGADSGLPTPPDQTEPAPGSDQGVPDQTV